MKRAHVAGIVLLSLAIGACSVSVPRHEAASLAVDGAGFQNGGTTGGVASGSAPTVAGVRGVGTQAAGAAVGSGGFAAGGAVATSATGTSAGRSVRVPGVTNSSITISVIAGFSGVLAGMVARAYDGLATWQDDVNAAGGIYGRKVKLLKIDHKESADGGVAACKEALSNGSFMAIVPEGIDATLTAVSCLDAAGMPTLYYSATTDPRWKVAFADIIPASLSGTEMGGYVRNRLGGSTKKVGVMYVNQASYKEMAQAFAKETRRRGGTVTLMESVEPNQASFIPQLQRMSNAGVKILVISATAEAIGIIRDARSLRYNPTFTGFGFHFDFVTTGGRSLFDGVTGLRGYATVDTPAYAHYAARMQAHGRGRNRTDDLEGFNAYGHGLVLGEVLKRAGRNPSWPTLVAGAETFRGWDNGIVGPLTWTVADHLGTHATFPVVCCSSDYTWKSAGHPQTSY